MGGAEQGLVWSLTIIVMPILLGLAIAYGVWQSYKRRKHGAPRTGAGGIHEAPPRSDERDNRKIATVGAISVVTLLLLIAVLLIIFR